MENASKALIIAGGMLLAILVLSLLVMGWNQISSFNKKQEEIETVEQIIKFNKEFESYNKGLVRGYELVSLNNLINDTNKRYDEIDGYTPIVGYIKLLEGTTLCESLGDGYKNFWKKDTTFVDFFKEYNFFKDHRR